MMSMQLEHTPATARSKRQGGWGGEGEHEEMGGEGGEIRGVGGGACEGVSRGVGTVVGGRVSS